LHIGVKFSGPCIGDYAFDPFPLYFIQKLEIMYTHHVAKKYNIEKQNKAEALY
jgi:hypothetical protein